MTDLDREEDELIAAIAQERSSIWWPLCELQPHEIPSWMTVEFDEGGEVVVTLKGDIRCDRTALPSDLGPATTAAIMHLLRLGFGRQGLREKKAAAQRTEAREKAVAALEDIVWLIWPGEPLEADMGEMDIVERLRDPEYAGCMQHLRSYDEIDRLFNASADLIESYMADADAHVSRLEIVRRQDDEIRDLKAEIESLRSDLARIAKERDDAVKALEPFADVVEKAETAAAHFGVRHVEEVDDSLPYGHMDVTWGDLRRAAAIRQMGGKP